MKKEKGIIIAFSGKIGSGKTSTATALGDKMFPNNYKIVSFSIPLKAETDTIVKLIKSLPDKESIDNLLKNSFFDSVNKDKARHAIEIIFNDVRNGNIVDGYNKTPELRKFYQYWGTEVRRKENNNYWIIEMDKTVSPLIHKGINIIIDDVRFENEAYFVLLKKGKLYRLNVDAETRKNRVQDRDGKQTSVNNSHDSETNLDDFDRFTKSYEISEQETIDDIVNMIISDIEN